MIREVQVENLCLFMLISNGRAKNTESLPRANTKSLEVLDSNPRKDRRTGYSDC
jgi:hypothetical protein